MFIESDSRDTVMAHAAGWMAARYRSSPRRNTHSTDISDRDWRLIEPLFPEHHRQTMGRPRSVDLHQAFNALVYLLRSDKVLRSLPQDFGVTWGTLHSMVWHWAKDGTLAKVLGTLGDQGLIEAAKRKIRIFKG
jgi:transposase